MKQHKRRIRELEISLASEKGRIEELEGEKAELEQAKRTLEKQQERNKKEAVEKERERHIERTTTSAPRVGSTKTNATEGTKGPSKSKKRPRDEDDEEEEEEEGGLVIHGAFGMPVERNEQQAKKRKKVRGTLIRLHYTKHSTHFIF